MKLILRFQIFLTYILLCNSNKAEKENEPNLEEVIFVNIFI